jgi:hypothetical protein
VTAYAQLLPAEPTLSLTSISFCWCSIANTQWIPAVLLLQLWNICQYQLRVLTPQTCVLYLFTYTCSVLYYDSTTQADKVRAAEPIITQSAYTSLVNRLSQLMAKGTAPPTPPPATNAPQNINTSSTNASTGSRPTSSSGSRGGVPVELLKQCQSLVDKSFRYEQFLTVMRIHRVGTARSPPVLPSLVRQFLDGLLPGFELRCVRPHSLTSCAK